MGSEMCIRDSGRTTTPGFSALWRRNSVLSAGIMRFGCSTLGFRLRMSRGSYAEDSIKTATSMLCRVPKGKAGGPNGRKLRLLYRLNPAVGLFAYTAILSPQYQHELLSPLGASLLSLSQCTVSLMGERKERQHRPLRKSMRDLHSFVPLARRCAGHGLPRGSRSLGLPPPHGWLSTPWVRLVRRCSLAALHKAARSRVAS